MSLFIYHAKEMKIGLGTAVTSTAAQDLLVTPKLPCIISTEQPVQHHCYENLM